MKAKRPPITSPRCCACAPSASAASPGACRLAASSSMLTPAPFRRRSLSGAKSSKLPARGGSMRTVLLSLALAVSSLAQAQIEKSEVHIAVGGKTALYYLPLTITERLGYFKNEGLNVRISDFPGGTRSLEAVVGGSADVVSVGHEHTINIQTRKHRFQAFRLAGAGP